jgi:Protein of unknown function (DUF2490)
MKYIVIFICALCMSMVQAQRQTTDNLNGWFMYFGDHKFADKWGVHIEAQFRRNDIVTNGQQLLLRTGLNYHLNPSVFFTAGYCFVQTDPYGEFPVKASFPEHRLWEQMQIKTQLQSTEWTGRFRLEQRFSQLPVNKSGIWTPDTAVYTNRFRLLNRFSMPLKGSKIEDKSFYITAYDEIFINFGERVGMNLLDQNRAYIALGYKIPKIGRLEGYMQQTIFKPNTTTANYNLEYNHTLQVGLSSTLDFRKTKIVK